jgi:hypothetical protein
MFLYNKPIGSEREKPKLQPQISQQLILNNNNNNNNNSNSNNNVNNNNSNNKQIGIISGMFILI